MAVDDSKNLINEEKGTIPYKVLTLENSRKIYFNNFNYNKNDIQANVTNRTEATLVKSIQMAHKYAKKFVKTIDPSNTFLEQDVELILSDVFKDGFKHSSGSSAGCGTASILISLALQKPIYQNLAMTGQISPDGKIGPVGGIAEKVKATVAAGLEKVIIPKENQKDFEALPSEIKNNIKVVYAETFQDIYDVAFKKT